MLTVNQQLNRNVLLQLQHHLETNFNNTWHCTLLFTNEFIVPECKDFMESIRLWMLCYTTHGLCCVPLLNMMNYKQIDLKLLSQNLFPRCLLKHTCLPCVPGLLCPEHLKRRTDFKKLLKLLKFATPQLVSSAPAQVLPSPSPH